MITSHFDTRFYRRVFPHTDDSGGIFQSLNDRPEVSCNAEDDYQHGIVDIKSVGDKGQDTH